MTLTWSPRASRPYRRNEIAAHGRLFFSVWEDDEHEIGFRIFVHATEGLHWQIPWCAGEGASYEDAKARAEAAIPHLEALLDAGISPSTAK